MNYRLKAADGEVSYLMRAGMDVVMHHTNAAAAKWACDHNAPRNECISGHPEYCVHSGEFYFEGCWEADMLGEAMAQRKRRVKDSVCE